MPISIKMIQRTETGVLVTNFRSEQREFPVPISKFTKALSRYGAGAYIQDAFSFLSTYDREWLMTGQIGLDWFEQHKDEDDEG
jgi:hypothetical protein